MRYYHSYGAHLINHSSPQCPRRGNINITSEVSSSFLLIQYKRRGVAALLAARYAYKINIPLGEYLRVSYKTNKINQIGESKRMEGSNPRQFEWTHVCNGQGEGERATKIKGEHEWREGERERGGENESWHPKNLCAFCARPRPRPRAPAPGPARGWSARWGLRSGHGEADQEVSAVRATGCGSAFRGCQ